MGIVNPYNADEVALIDRMSSKTRQPNVAGDSNRDFLMMEKKVYEFELISEDSLLGDFTRRIMLWIVKTIM